MTDKDKEKPKDIPMPVPSFSQGEKKVSDPTKVQDKIDHDSDQDNPTTTPPPDQIDAGGTPVTSPTSESPASPPVKDDDSSNVKKEIPALPFNGKDPMAQGVGNTTKSAADYIKNPPAVPGKTSDMDLDKQISDKKTENWLKAQGKEYQVHGKFRPDAASIQGAANRNKVSSEILRAIQTKEYTEVLVRSHYNGQYVDTIVHHDHETTRNMLLLEMAAKHPETVEEFTDKGMPVFKPGAVFIDAGGKQKNLMYTVMHSLLSDINFSIRDATTKAASAGQAKILNQDWQSEDEKEMETKERELVEEIINSRND